MDSRKVIVAMSGGVDSSVTAYRMIKEGYEVVGATLKMGRACDNIAIEDAKTVCGKLGIQHNVIEVEKSFKQNVINYFYDDYLNGKTPNPCAKCNRDLKFKEMLNFMKEQKASFIATGHYAKIINNNNIYELHRGKDIKKDQSYFLATLKYEDLQYIKFPLHEIEKTEVRKIAENIDLHIAEKNDSQDACFIETDYKDFLYKNFNVQSRHGYIVNLQKQVVGEHNGIINYTIGQRKGLGISYKTPLYVVELDPINNLVIVGDNNDLFRDSLQIEKINIFNNEIYNENTEFLCKLRSTHYGEFGKITIRNGIGNIKLNKPVRAITKGQLCVLYKNSMVIGSGWII